MSGQGTYAIDDGDSDLIVDGLQGYDYARRTAQRIADERGEPVYLYDSAPADDELDEFKEEYERVDPDISKLFNDDQLLRDVVMEEVLGRVYRLRVWDTYDRDRYGKSVLAYRFERIKPEAEAEVIFEGSDFGPGASTAIDSDEMLTGLMGFLTLRPGDTDGEYFEAYTSEQLEFAESYDAEAMQILGMEDEDGYDEEGEDEPHVRFLDYDEYLEGK